MNNRLLFVSCCLTVCAMTNGAFSQDAELDPLGGVAHEVSVSLDDCKRLVAHVPSDDVAFKPGVDVRGKAVTPAEGPADGATLGAIDLPDEIVIDFGYDFAGAYGIPNTGLETATANILTISYDLELGGLAINGKPLTKSDARAVAKACELMLKGEGGEGR